MTDYPPEPYPLPLPLARELTNLERIGQITEQYLGLRDPKQVEEWFRQLRKSGETDAEQDSGDDWKR